MTIFLLPRYQTSYIDKDFQKQIVNGQSHVNINRLAETVSAVTQPQVNNCSSLFLSFSLPPSIDSSLSLSHSSSLPASFLSSHVSAKLPRLLSVHMLGSSPRYHRGIHPQTKSLHQVFWMASVTESC